MPSCEKLYFGNCENVEVKVAAKTGSIYMMYREYKVKDGADYKEAPIIVSRLSMKHILLEIYIPDMHINFQKSCSTTDTNYNLCNDNTCTITTGDGGVPNFLYICGEYTGGVMQVTSGNLKNMWQFCASLYNCSDPANCWMEDIKAYGAPGGIGGGIASGVVAVSVMPGCEIMFSGASTADNTTDPIKFNMKDTEPEPATGEYPLNWRVIQEHFPNATGGMDVTLCDCKRPKRGNQ